MRANCEECGKPVEGRGWSLIGYDGVWHEECAQAALDVEAEQYADDGGDK
jgi:hypothetical protein